MFETNLLAVERFPSVKISLFLDICIATSHVSEKALFFHFKAIQDDQFYKKAYNFISFLGG